MVTESPPASALGKYEIVGRLARGQTTDLLLARTRGMAGFERYVALKCVRPERSGDAVFVHAFVNEARLAAALHHHNIVQVQDISDEGGLPFFAMEYIQGEDLRSVLAKLHGKHEQLPLQHLVTIGTSVAAALHHAHEQRGPDGRSLGIIHRDVSPGNIIVGYDGNVKVVDFSMAKATITTVTSVGVVRGKAGYMAPEQCAGEKLDRRSDVFALGIVLYEMATLERLFKGNSDHDTMSTIVLGTIPKPRTVRPEVPQKLEDIIMKALARLPADRYQTAAELGAALEKFAVEEGVAASTTALAAFVKEHFGEPREPGEGVATRDARKDFDGSGVGVAAPAGAEPRRRIEVLRKNTTEADDKSEFENEAPTKTVVDDEPPKSKASTATPPGATTQAPTAAALGAAPLNPSSIAAKFSKMSGSEQPTVKADRADIEKGLAIKAALAEADKAEKNLATKVEKVLPLPARPTPQPAKLETAAAAALAKAAARQDQTPLPKAKDDSTQPEPALVDPSAETPAIDDDKPRASTSDDVSTVKVPKPIKVAPNGQRGPLPVSKGPESVAPTAPAMAAVEPPADGKPEEIKRGDMTELVAPLPPPATAERSKTVPPKAMALVQKYRWWLVGAAGALVVVGIAAVIATSGASDLEVGPAAKDETAAPAPAPTPVAEPPKPEPKPEPVAEPPKPEPEPVAAQPEPPKPEPVAEPPKPEPEPAKPEPVVEKPKHEPKHVAEKSKPEHVAEKKSEAGSHKPEAGAHVVKKTTPATKQTTKKKPGGMEYDPNSLFLGGPK